MNYKNKIILSTILVIISVLTAFGIESYQSMSDLNEKVIRFHVLANSNTEEDQSLKLKVRNEIISTFNKELEFNTSKEESEVLIISKLDEIREQAEETIKKEGYNYEVNVYYGNYEFPRKQYEDIVLPAGNYDAVKIEIGKAEGNNWWCVMFPQLCFVDLGQAGSDPIFDVETESKLSEVLTADEIASIKTKRGLEDISFKSKFFEFIEKGRVENSGILASDDNRTFAVSLSKEDENDANNNVISIVDIIKKFMKNDETKIETDDKSKDQKGFKKFIDLSALGFKDKNKINLSKNDNN